MQTYPEAEAGEGQPWIGGEAGAAFDTLVKTLAAIREALGLLERAAVPVLADDEDGEVPGVAVIAEARRFVSPLGRGLDDAAEQADRIHQRLLRLHARLAI